VWLLLFLRDANNGNILPLPPFTCYILLTVNGYSMNTGGCMAKVNLSQAAKMAKISRPHLYKRYIETGKITVDRSDPKAPLIDTAELLRVFGEIGDYTGNSTDDSKQLHETTPKFTPENSHLQHEVTALRERLQAAQDQLQAAGKREEWLQGQVDKLTDAVRLLEHKPEVQARRKGFFARVFGGGQ
jgi:regulator of replication initiation timing